MYMLMLASSLCTYNVDHVCAAFCVIRRSHMLQHCCGLLSALHLEACSEAAWAYKLLMHLVNTCSSAHYSTLVNLSCSLHCVCVCVCVSLFSQMQDCLDLIEGKPQGLLAMLDDECRMGVRGTDKYVIQIITTEITCTCVDFSACNTCNRSECMQQHY